ncbi:HAD family hydrolase [[Limnothrix rosea] IAM M-220]|uniref:HAD family hydrolase n=1 Tax=[Limnothrix rosea] IAM M-220 TaxID=454133 RepID=UPI0009590C61|nr:HAD hydrolase-like protein [[Limnothrix rosea] IAM M-220]OKH13792.1 haloacid dehalogenase [[Limnothrix rosea] IAM M-220]
MRLISDFDGVIIDLSERYYHVYRWSLAQIAAPEQPITPLTKAEFWQLKRTQTPRPEIGLKSGLTEAQIPKFIELRNDHAHALENMVHDKIIDGSVEALQTAKELGWEIMTVTMRRASELQKVMDLNPVLNDLIPGDRRFTKSDRAERERDIDLKPILLDETLLQLPPADIAWMVGDTEADIRSARACNIPIISVLSGIRDRQILESFKPDYIAENLLEAVQLIQTKL